MALITADDYDWIRKRIDASLNSQSLLPEVIELYVDEGERWVTDRVTVDGLDAAQLIRAKLAAKYYVAHLIAPTVNIPTSDAGVAGASYTRQVMKPAENAQRLLNLAEGELGTLTVDVPDSSDDLQLVEMYF